MLDPSRVRVSGPLEVFAPGFAAEVARVGYRRVPVVFQLQLMAHASRWLASEGLGVEALTGERLRPRRDRRDRARAVRIYRPLPAFAAATGLRPEEWAALERRDVDRRGGVVNCSGRSPMARSSSSRKRAAAAGRCRSRAGRARRSSCCRRGWTHRCCSRPRPGGLLILDNFRRREWAPAVEASGVRRPARIYDLRATFASNALAADVSVFELARVLGTSVRMIERDYGALLDGAGAGIASRLDAFEAEQDQAAGERSEDV